jgi:hypothetical protein
MRSGTWSVGALVLLAAAEGGQAGEEKTPALAQHLAAVQAVDTEGQGQAAAQVAWQQLSQVEASELPNLLSALDEARPLAANWICTAIDAVAERQLQSGGKLPVRELEAFVLERRHQPRARRLAFEWLSRADGQAPDRLVPAMLDDPSLELRRDAVARALAQADELGDAAAAAQAYRRALTAARDLDQVQKAADALKKLGQEVDLARHFGFVLRWRLIGPFDNRSKKGFGVVYPPEESLDAAAGYEGKEGQVRWIEHITDDPLGKVDLNKALGKHMGAAAYAWSDFESPAARAVELRLGSDAATKVWLNGELLGSHEVYHANFEVDQYVCRGTLRPGRNVILVKVCQNEQTESWAQDWQFQFRVCDATGTAILPQPAAGGPAGNAPGEN